MDRPSGVGFVKGIGMMASDGPEPVDDGVGGAAFEGDDPPLAVRRATDRCFFAVEEITAEGVIVEGFLIRFDEIEEFRMTEGGGEACGG
ncbi:MAG: hypothetical protein RLN76_12795 [Phycisphaeraceae bacterium]